MGKGSGFVSRMVRKLTSDNPRQQQRLSSIAPLIDAKLAELKQTIDLRRNEGFDAATKAGLYQFR